MIRTKILLSFGTAFFLLQILLSQPLSLKINQPLIIDTDCDIQDFRALAMMLSYDAFNIRAILISEGIANPENAVFNIEGLLKASKKDSIPIGLGKISLSQGSSGDEFYSSLKWTDENFFIDKPGEAFPLLSELIDKTKDKITFLAMGSLENIAELLIKKPSAIDRIDRIIWYYDKPLKTLEQYYSKPNDNAGLPLNDDKPAKAIEKVLNSGMRIDIISNTESPEAVFDFSFLQEQKEGTFQLSVLLKNFYSINSLSNEQFNKQIQLKDELLPLYLTNSDLFNTSTIAGNRMLRLNTGFDLNSINELINDMLNGEFYLESNIVFNKFPVNKEMFSYDIRHIMDSVLIKYGFEEWKACVLTNEFHGHLGIYSVIGVKMGILAREYFNVDRDILKVHSYAGYITPYSCFNDGIQVSTGATLGMNLISVSETKIPIIKADFSYGNSTVTMELKQEYSQQIESDITEGIVKYGLEDDGYWKLVRKASVKYWLEWDRNELFDITIIK